jgi:hypothetical protein
MERIQSSEIDQSCHGDKEIAMSCSSIAKKFGYNPKFFHASNNVLHQDTSFVDDVIVEFFKQSERMIALGALGLVDLVVRDRFSAP